MTRARKSPRKGGTAPVRPKVFDIDAMAAEAGYQPVQVRFRGQEYQLGNTAAGLFKAADLADKLPDDDTAAIVTALPDLLEILSPGWPAEEQLTVAEEMVLVQAVTEVMNRLGQARFQD
jgi:hypothetical protein